MSGGRTPSRGRRLGLDRNPLRRNVDRTERRALFALTILAVIAIPFALLVGSIVYQRGLATASAQASTRYPTTAILEKAAPPAGPTRGVPPPTYPPARWLDASGTKHTGRVPAQPETPAGTSIPIWIDAAGNLTDAPLGPGEAATAGWLAVLGVMVGVIGVLTGVFYLVRRRLDRIRAAAWEAEWRLIGPQWTSGRT